ncbi:MAG: hypothetical protein A2293_15285 [Elusimicrobia bacterium RIFOXYB2_FULL_49_7]|nr:MAG: hypothetical protein A2293_15285 [Elusimicrobia bacterium RIFOXYB2_FULL_49_7]
MKEIKIAELKKGTAAEFDYYGRDGKILIKKGVPVDDTLLNAISRRNITRFFIQEEGEDIKKLLALNMQDMDDLQFEEDSSLSDLSPASSATETITFKLPPENVLPVLKTIKSGEEGIRQMLETKPVRSMDDAVDKSGAVMSVLPIGEPIEKMAKEKKVGERTMEYKQETIRSYENAVQETKSILLSIRNGALADGGRVTNLVRGFVRTFLNDKHMLLNLANARSTEPDYLFSHSVNVCLIAISIGASRGFDKDQILEIGIGGLLHDIGTLLIPDAIRFKKEPLSRDEILEIRKHPMLGIHLVEKIKGLPSSVSFICYQNHERENRQGYPKQRNSRLIHDFAKIVSVADVYESLTADRPYRNGHIPYKAMESILRSVKEGLFNADIVKYFLDYSSLFPVGSLVKLNSNEIAKVIRPNKGHYSKPIVSVIINSNNALLKEHEIHVIDLSTAKDVQVVQAVDNRKLQVELMIGF